MSRSLYPVSQHTDSRLCRLWNRPGIRKVRRIRRNAITLLGLLQEIGDRRRAVVLRDERSHTGRQVILSGKLQTFADVIPDNRGTRRGLELVVRVPAARLVLDEILGLLELADIMVVGTD